MAEKEGLYFAELGDKFGGYDIRAVGRTPEEAAAAVLKLYAEVYKNQNGCSPVATGDYATAEEEVFVAFMRCGVAELY